MMHQLRVSAVLVENDDGHLAGILTERDVVTRVLAQGLSPDATCVAAVMTPQPKCVATNSKVRITPNMPVCVLPQVRLKSLIVGRAGGCSPEHDAE